MRTSTIATLAFTAAALTTTIASAAGFVGNTVAAAPVRNVVAMSQTSTMSMLLALPIKVIMCSGAGESPVFVATGLATARATGSTYTIDATLINVTTTRFLIRNTGMSNNGILKVNFGGMTQSMVFDRSQPSPGSAGSLTGQDVAYLGGSGFWNAQAIWSSPIKVGAAAVQNDAYNMLTINFSTCFMAGNFIQFNVDTDKAG